ncbi:DKNYY domain-containing protein [Wohlfahrtiimonas populi]|uniref:DKNYY domain-containing protein n=1 Tax=Wohlfahrtiimonas populi TaxID=1940240 RepID=UPI00098D4D49|nr:DKNYY domain-containing protein [Wohlfahrtiimonas populi]
MELFSSNDEYNRALIKKHFKIMKIINFFLCMNILLVPTMLVLANESPNNKCELIYKNFSQDDSNVYYRGHKLYSADPKNFKVIGESQYSLDSNSVYYEIFRIVGADPLTFELLDPNDDRYAKDATRVYLAGKVIEGANPKYFKHIQGSFYKDDRYVFYVGEQLEDSDAESFFVLGSGFGQDTNNLYQIFHGMHGGISIQKINLQNQGITSVKDLIYLEYGYFKYLGEYYYLDYDLLIHLKLPNIQTKYIAGNYFRDDSTIYYHERKSGNNKYIFTIMDADIDTFQRVEMDGVSLFKDSQGCYKGDGRVNCDTVTEHKASLSVSNRQASGQQYLANCDNKFLWYQNQFYFLFDSKISLDDKHVYYDGKVLKGADPLTFEYIGANHSHRTYHEYFRDKNNVYLNDKVIKSIDVETFVLLSDLRVRDRYQILLRSTLEKLIEN